MRIAISLRLAAMILVMVLGAGADDCSGEGFLDWADPRFADIGAWFIEMKRPIGKIFPAFASFAGDNPVGRYSCIRWKPEGADKTALGQSSNSDPKPLWPSARPWSRWRGLFLH